MKHGSLFSGIGGFDLAAQWMGWENVFHCEWNEYNQKVLKQNFPNSISYGNITTTDFLIHRGQIGILTGGFPCQPFSLAGEQKGTEDERHLWPEMLRAAREIQPGWIVGENVFGLVSWNGGMVFEQVQADLEAEGYEVFPAILPACGINAPHRRDRIWFIAYSSSFAKSFRLLNRDCNKSSKQGYEKKIRGADRFLPEMAPIFDSRVPGWEREFSESKMVRIPNGLSPELEQIKGYGNAIVPQVALQIFKAIEAYQQSLFKAS